MALSVMSDVLNVAEFLLGDKSPDEVALLTLAGDHTYGDLQQASQAVAEYLTAIGGRRGDRALIVSDNSFFSVSAYLGIMYAGLVSVPLPATTTPVEFEYALRLAGPRAAFLQGSFARTCRSLPSELSVVVDKAIAKSGIGDSSTFSELRDRFRAKSFTPAEVHSDDLAALMFTSGSTGSPRAVMVSHLNIVANTESIIDYLQLTDRDRIMAVLPLHYCFGASLLHTHLRVGGSVVLDNRFLYPNTILERMSETHCTGFAGVPSHFQILLQSSCLRETSFPHLRYVQQAGGSLAPASISDLQEALPATELFIMYGQTEATARLSYLPPECLPTKLGSIGKGIPGVRLRVLNDAGEEVGPGETGEIVASGENITQGYWRDPQESAAAFKNGELYTGDIATVDQEGFIFIVDRAKDFLKCGGKRVGCRQIEQEILKFGNLLEVAVIGVPDPILGEAVKVFVVPQSPDPTIREDIHAFCKQTLAPQLIPQQIVILDTLPKNEAGKVAKQLLRKL